jgi:hypothetical protein
VSGNDEVGGRRSLKSGFFPLRISLMVGHSGEYFLGVHGLEDNYDK